MPTKKNRKGEYLPETTAHQVRYRQFDPSLCKKGSYKTITPENKEKFGKSYPTLPPVPSYKADPWDAKNLSLVVCTRTDTHKRAIQSVREPRMKE